MFHKTPITSRTRSRPSGQLGRPGAVSLDALRNPIGRTMGVTPEFAAPTIAQPRRSPRLAQKRSPSRIEEFERSFEDVRRAIPFEQVQRRNFDPYLDSDHDRERMDSRSILSVEPETEPETGPETGPEAVESRDPRDIMDPMDMGSAEPESAPGVQFVEVESDNENEKSFSGLPPERNAVLLNIVDPIVDRLEQSAQLFWLTLKYLLGPLLTKKVLQFLGLVIIMLTVPLIAIYIGGSVGTKVLRSIPSFGLGSINWSRPYRAPEVPPEDMPELRDRLMALEHQFESLSRATSSVQISVVDNAKGLEGLRNDVESVSQGLASLSTNVASISSQVYDQQSLSDALQSTMEQVEAAIKRLQSIVNTNGEEIATVQSNLTFQGNGLASVTRSVEHFNEAIRAIDRRVGYLEQAEDIEARILSYLDQYLPKKMVVSIDPKTRAVDAVPEFWTFLHGVINDRMADILDSEDFASAIDARAPVTKSPRSSATSDWNEFLRVNEKALQAFVRNELKSGSVISSDEFKNMVKAQLESERQHLSERIEDLDSRLKDVAQVADGSREHEHTRMALEELVQEHITAYVNKVKVLKPNYASLASGARIDYQHTSPTFSPLRGRPFWYKVARGLSSSLGFGRIKVKSPLAALDEDISLGNCWAVNWNKGELGIVLAAETYPTDFAIDHVSSMVTLAPSTAPKNVTFWIQVDDLELRHRVRGLIYQPEHDGIPEDYVKVAGGMYNVYGTYGEQLFPVPAIIQGLKIGTRKVIVSIEDNWGNPYFTSLYSVKVYGDSIRPANEPPMAAPVDFAKDNQDQDLQGAQDASFGSDEDF
uniref:ARAD1A13860p n=1 Tax=Blastobotrys adeninivorans TaxID=409370 RepID=A0A060SY55_BLAAD